MKYILLVFSILFIGCASIDSGIVISRHCSVDTIPRYVTIARYNNATAQYDESFYRIDKKEYDGLFIGDCVRIKRLNHYKHSAEKIESEAERRIITRGHE